MRAVWWQLKWGLEVSAEFLPKSQERLSRDIQEKGQDGPSFIRGGKFLGPVLYSLPMEMHCDPCNNCFEDTQICSNDIFGGCTQ